MNRLRYKVFPAILGLFLTASFSISCQEEQASSVDENIDETVLSLEHKALDHWSQGHPLGYASNFADDVTYFDDIGAQGRINGTEEVQTYFTSLEGKIPPHDYEMVDPKVQVYGDIAILTFQYHSTIDTMQGPPWKATSVYQLRDSSWQVVHANWSLVKQP